MNLRRALPPVLIFALVAAALWITHSTEGARHASSAGVVARDRGEFETESAAPRARSDEERIATSTDVSTAPEAEHRSRVTRITAVDLRGSPVSGVDLYSRSDEVLRPLGASDDRGELSISLISAEWTSVLGRRDGFAIGKSGFAGPPPAELRVVLPNAASIRGQVVVTSGQPAPEGVRVVAVPRDERLSFFGLSPSRLESDPELALAWTDTHGEFQIVGVREGATYELHAGGRGVLTSRALTGIAGGAEGVVVTVTRGYAVLYELQDVDGSRPCIEEAFGARGSIKTTIRQSATAVSALPPSAALLLGAQFPSDLGPLRHLVLLASDLDVGELGPIGVQIHPFGYAQVEASIYAQPVEAGIRIEPTIVTRTASAFGAMELDLSAVHVDVRRARSRVGSVAFLELTNEQGETSQFALRGDSPPLLRFDCLPVGSYSTIVSVDPRCEAAKSLGVIAVEAGQTARARIDAQALGSITVDVRSSDGAPIVGDVHIGLGQSSTPPGEDGSFEYTGGTASFRHPPYYLPFLVPGRYWVWLEAGFARTRCEVVVTGGTTTSVQLVLPH